MNVAAASAIIITAFLAAGVLLLISFNKRIRRLQNNPSPELLAAQKQDQEQDEAGATSQSSGAERDRPAAERYPREPGAPTIG